MLQLKTQSTDKVTPQACPVLSPTTLSTLLNSGPNLATGTDPVKLNQFIEEVYVELHRLAHAHMRREQRRHTLQTTALVHETYLRLARCKGLNLSDRRLFFGLASRIMRHILVDYARGANAAKRGADYRIVSIREVLTVTELPSAEILSLHEALSYLEAHDPKLGQVLELHAFGGLSNLEIAETLGISLRTVNRELALARAWLRHFLSRESSAQASKAPAVLTSA
ncbi:MAG: ECF-type sigma factor [Acidobacteriota bacterium]